MSDQAHGRRYELRERIADGGMGTVWVAWDRKYGRWVAAKVLRHTDAAMVLRFVREQSLRIAHPHVVSPQGWSADDDHVVLSMDLVRGGSLQTLIGDQGPLPEPFAAVILDQLLDGLGAIHAQGVVHRDLKPANILLEPTGTGWPCARIGDFGIAAVLGEPRFTAVGQSIGTLGYMPPEQAQGGEPVVSHDLYALGMIGKRMLTGAASARPPAGPLTDWLDRLTAADPAERPASARAARDQLHAAGLVPRSPVWQHAEDPPEVFDQLAPPAAQRTAAAPALASQPPAGPAGQRLATPPTLAQPPGAPPIAQPPADQPPRAQPPGAQPPSAQPPAAAATRVAATSSNLAPRVVAAVSFALGLIALIVLLVAVFS